METNETVGAEKKIRCSNGLKLWDKFLEFTLKNRYTKATITKRGRTNTNREKWKKKHVLYYDSSFLLNRKRRGGKRIKSVVNGKSPLEQLHTALIYWRAHHTNSLNEIFNKE